MIGQLISHYRVLEQLGAGGMGVVYLARDEQLGRQVAIKLLSPGALADEAARQRFRNEAQLLAQLNHPNIEMVFDFGTHAGQDFLVLEYIPGQTIRQLLSAGPLPEEKLLRLAAMLAAGLEAAHGKGILHRDLKPSNLVLTPEGRLKILDFGLAIAQNSEHPQSDKRLAGTLPYMPPEQLRGEPNDARSDLYSAGAVLYEMATGRPPFAATEPAELTDSILHETPSAPRERNPNLSTLCEALLLKALQKSPDGRHQSAPELRGELERIYALRQPATATRSLDQSQAPTLEMSYVLFMDIVGYSRLATDTQQTTLRQLQRIVRATNEFQRAQSENRLIRLPTGDGMALAFFTDPEAPVRCAVEVSRALKTYAERAGNSEIPVRIGMHAGPVYRVTDINGNQNVAGEGINVAQRVMDCGDAGHLLVSKVLADVLRQLSGWSGALRDLGEVKVKHGLQIHVFNLLSDGVGNAALPQKIQAQQPQASQPAPSKMDRRAWMLTGVAVLVFLTLMLALRKYIPGSSASGQPAAADVYSHPRRPTIAILGFKNLNNSTEANWVSTTLADMLTNELEAGNHVITTPGEDVSRVKRDLSLTEELTYGEDSVQRIHKALHCDYLVYGSFFAPGKGAGSTVRLSLRLQNANSGETLALVTENGTELKLDEIASRVGSSLRSKLNIPSISPAESDAIQASIPSADATKPFYLGVERLRNFDFLGARELLQKAVASDPNFAPAYAALAQAWIGLGYDAQAREAAQKAFDLSKHLPREDQLMVEARLREISTEWDKAVSIYQSLWTVYPENPEYALRAADVLIRAGRGNDALKTIQMLRGQPGPIASDPRLDLKSAEAYNSLGDFAHEKEAATQAANKAQERGSRLLRAEALWRACEAALNLGDAAGARPACQQSITIAQPLNDLLLLARATTILGRVAEAQGKPSEAIASYNQALQYAKKIGSRRDVAGALINIGNIQSTQGDHLAAQKSLQEALAVAHEINDTGQIITLINNLAVESQLAGNYPAALRLYKQSLEAARAINDRAGVGRALGNIGSIESMQGDFPLALESIQEAMKTAQETGAKADQVGFLYALGDTKLAQGDLPAAEASYQSAETLASQINDQLNIALGQLSLSGLKVLRGQHSDALTLARRAAAVFRSQGMKDQESQSHALAASCLLALGNLVEAGKEIETAQQLAPQDPVIKMTVAITASRIALRDGKVAQGKRDLGSVAAQARRLGLPAIQFEARIAQGEAGLFGADKRSSLAALSAIQQEASRMGYKEIEVRAKEIARQVADNPA